MAIEVTAQEFLFDSDPFTERDKVMEQGIETVQTEVPFCHNHLHDLESLWWVAVWVVFHSTSESHGHGKDLPVNSPTV
jgi:hypothetical protein